MKACHTENIVAHSTSSEAEADRTPPYLRWGALNQRGRGRHVVWCSRDVIHNRRPLLHRLHVVDRHDSADRRQRGPHRRRWCCRLRRRWLRLWCLRCWSGQRLSLRRSSGRRADSSAPRDLLRLGLRLRSVHGRNLRLDLRSRHFSLHDLDQHLHGGSGRRKSRHRHGVRLRVRRPRCQAGRETDGVVWRCLALYQSLRVHVHFFLHHFHDQVQRINLVGWRRLQCFLLSCCRRGSVSHGRSRGRRGPFGAGSGGLRRKSRPKS